MSDITITRGYGFPRGSGMDYAGYGRFGGRSFGGMLVNNPRRQFRAAPIPYVPEPSVFEKIPALDGFGEFGSEYEFTRSVIPAAQLGDITLPTLDVETGEWEQPAAAGAGKALGLVALGVGLWFLFGR